MNTYDLNSARHAAAAMLLVLNQSIEEHERQLVILRAARDATKPVADLAEIPAEDFKPPAGKGLDVLRAAMEAVEPPPEKNGKGKAL